MQTFSGNKVGISGGTFDPIHYGHLIIAEEIRESMGLDRVVFIPTGQPPHKDGNAVSPALHRYNMVCAAVASNPYFTVSSMEIDRSGPTYTVDTIKQLRQVYDKDTKIYFITGADVIPELVSWKNFMEIFSLCTFVAAMRPGYNRDEIAEEILRIKKAYQADIILKDTLSVAISSTYIRDCVRRGRSIKYLVPEAVEEYIYKNSLYKNSG